MYGFQAPTTNATPTLTKLGEAVDFWGFAATNTASGAGFYLKLWWQSKAASSIPVIGTTPPNFTAGVTNSAGTTLSLGRPMNPGGPCWYSVTLNSAQTDDTALGAGGDIITLFLE